MYVYIYFTISFLKDLTKPYPHNAFLFVSKHQL